MIFCDMTNVFVPSNDLAVSQLFFIFVISKTIYNQTIMLSFVCDYSEGAHPRILERLYESMTAAGEKIHGVQKFIFEHALSYAKHRNPLAKKNLVWKFYNKLVYAKLRKAMGGRFRLVISGGGALNKSICRFLLNVGFDVCEGYGLTECSPVVSVNRPGKARPGSVGQPLTHLQVKIGEHSEVLVKGESVFKGYRNRDNLNAEIFTEDGFFRTGDQGYFDRDGYLYLTGRLKELLKTSTGKYVSPNPIELELSRHLLIEQALTGTVKDDLTVRDNPRFRQVCCSYTMCARGGKVASVSGLDSIKDERIRTVEQFYHPGDTVPFGQTLAQRMLRFFIQADTIQETARVIDRIQDSVTVCDEKGKSILFSRFDTSRLL